MLHYESNQNHYTKAKGQLKTPHEYIISHFIRWCCVWNHYCIFAVALSISEVICNLIFIASQIWNKELINNNGLFYIFLMVFIFYELFREISSDLIYCMHTTTKINHLWYHSDFHFILHNELRCRKIDFCEAMHWPLFA